jgi:hypothetical protein
MKRPAGVIITAIVALLGSALFLLIAALEVVAVFFLSGRGAVPPEAKVGIYGGMAMFSVLGLWGIATGIGLFRLRNWARISVIIFSVFLALGCLFGAPTMFFIPAPPNAPPNFSSIMKVVAAFYALLGLLGVFWIYYFSRAKTRTVFVGTEQVESARPLSVSVIGWFLLASAMASVPFAFLHIPFIFAGVTFTGWWSTIVMLVLGGLYCYIGYGLLKLVERARLMAIGLFVLLALNSLTSIFVPGLIDRAMELASAMPWMPRAQQPVPTMPPLIFVMGIPLLAVPIWFLVTRKKAFERPEFHVAGSDVMP